MPSHCSADFQTVSIFRMLFGEQLDSIQGNGVEHERHRNEWSAANRNAIVKPGGGTGSCFLGLGSDSLFSHSEAAWQTSSSSKFPFRMNGSRAIPSIFLSMPESRRIS